MMELTPMMKKKIESGREYRALNMDAIDDDKFIVEGYATTFDEPYYLYTTENSKGEEVIVYEQVLRSAFDDTDMSDVIFQYDHEGRVYARLSNETMELNIDKKGLKTIAYLGGTDIGKSLYQEIKGGYTNKMSFGFTVKADKVEPYGDKDYIRTISKIGKLYDVSAVSYPQNNWTEISARSHVDGVINEIETERKRVEEERANLQKQKDDLLNKVKALRKD